MFKPQRLGTVTIPDAELTTDKKNCKKIGPCGVGEKAIYLNSFYFDRRYYIPISSIERIFKRIAMSKGGFTGKGAFGTLYMKMEKKNNVISNMKKMWIVFWLILKKDFLRFRCTV